MITFFKTIIYIPLYNIFVLILNLSWIDAGLAAVLLTFLVKFALYPISKKAAIAQIKMKEKEGELTAIKEKYKNKEEQALKVMEFYKNNNINPLSSIFTIIIQIPIVFSLYYIFFRSGLPTIDTSLVYSFVKVPESVSMIFLGFLDVSKKSVALAFLAAATTFLQMHLSTTSSESNGAPANKEDFAKIMAKQMKYTMPVIVFLISWKISGVVALYWFVSNLAGIAQDLYIKKQLAKVAI
jgi:YidC/Oxa1 family membrane protein insertase